MHQSSSRIDRSVTFVEVPGGILSAQGNFFRVRSEDIETLAPGLLERESLKSMIQLADTLLSAPWYAGYFGLLLGLLVSPWLGLMAAITFWLGMSVLRPAFSGPGLGRFAVRIFTDPVAFVASALVLGWLGYSGQLLPMGIGLAAFVAFRVVLVLGKVGKAAESPSKADRILSFVLQKHALAHGLPTIQLEEIQNKIIYYANMNPRRGKKTP